MRKPFFPSLFALLLPCVLRAAVSIPANDPLIRYSGRFDFTVATAPRFAWPGVMIEAAFSGTSVGIKLYEQIAYTNYFDARIDGGAPLRITSSSTSMVTHNITGLAAGNHTMTLVRRGESFNGATSGQEYSVFQGLDLDAGASLLALAPAPTRKFEVIGDSLSVGYGDEGTTLSCPGTVPRLTNNYLAYGSLVARTFCAQVHSTAISGHGMVSNYGDGSSSTYPLPALFDRVIPGAAAPLNDFNSWQPDAVIIFLGSNDFSTGSVPPNGPSQASYESAYHALIADLRSKYALSNPWIFCLHHTIWDGSAAFDFGSYVNNVVSYQNGTLGDMKVRSVDMDPYAGSACDYHPSLSEQQAMANRLRIAITAATGWTAGGCPILSTPTVSPSPSPTPSASRTSSPSATQSATMTATLTPSPIPPGPGKDFCVSVNYSAVPALLNDRKITLKVSVGNCSSVAVTADGSPISSSYLAGSGEALFSTSGSNIVVTAVGWTSGGTGAASKAYLHLDKGWAHSITLDDGIRDQYLNAKPLFDAKGWRAGVALNGSGIETGNPWNMTWVQAEALRAAGWDIFNHSYSHPTLTCGNFAAEFSQNQTLFQTHFPGYNATHVVFPFENTAVTGCAGYPPAYLFSGEGGGGTFNYVDVPFPNVQRVNRAGIYGTSTTTWQTLANSTAGNARPTWLITITHSVAPGASAPADIYSTNASTLGSYLDFLQNTYGSAGDQSMWFAPAGEVMDYVMTRDNAVVTSFSCGSPTPTPAASGTLSWTPSPYSSDTPTFSETPTPTVTPALLTATPAPAEGPLEIVKAMAFPNPGPTAFMLKLAGPADLCRVTIYTKGMLKVGELSAPGRNSPGWVSVPLSLQGLSSGIYYFEAALERGGRQGSKGATGKFFVIR